MNKGKRSRRRRAAKMRAKGFVHLDGTGWLHLSEIYDHDHAPR